MWRKTMKMSSLTYLLLGTMICTADNANGSKFTQSSGCVSIPPTPFQGSFTLRGVFLARLKCPSPDKDIPLNSPGQEGVLTCEPLSHANVYSFGHVKVPDCHHKLQPAKIQVTALTSFAVETCHGPQDEENRASTERLISTIIGDKDAPCGPGLEDCQRDVKFQCGVNHNRASVSIPAKQLDATITLTTNYEQTKPKDFYLNLTRQMRSRLGLTRDGTIREDTLAVWQDCPGEFLYVGVQSWKGTCSEHPLSVGTNLERAGVLTCRGCSKTYVLDDATCVPCDYGTYTEGPFEEACRRCPPEITWTSQQYMQELCYLRE